MKNHHRVKWVHLLRESKGKWIRGAEKSKIFACGAPPKKRPSKKNRRTIKDYPEETELKNLKSGDFFRTSFVDKTFDVIDGCNLINQSSAS